MNVALNLLLAAQILSALAMVGLILIQHGKGADMGAAFGSGSSGSLFGASGSANFLSRTTAVLATLFLACTLGLAYFGSAVRTAPPSTGSVLERAPAVAPGVVPGAPAVQPSTTPPTGADAIPGATPAAPGVPPAAPTVPATPAAPATPASGAAQIPGQ